VVDHEKSVSTSDVAAPRVVSVLPEGAFCVGPLVTAFEQVSRNHVWQFPRFP
jgi:hypothetical protein